VRLLLIRGWRHWVPLLLLLCFFSFAWTFLPNQNPADFINYLKQIDPQSFDAKNLSQTGSLLVPALTWLFLRLGIIATIWKGIHAFGVNPASLMASMSRSFRIRDIEAQTSFRQKFAVEFHDVTKALGNRPMSIFIDDLDRCQPKNVLEILEAINFLVSSGDCFVVLGMAPEIVKRSVGLSFKDVAEEMLDEPSKGGQQANPMTNGKDLRTRFAGQYLDKLINIEVPVPKLTPDQSRMLLVAEKIPVQQHTKVGRWQLAQNRIMQVLSFAAKLWLLGLVVLSLYVGQQLGKSVPNLLPEAATSQAQPSPTVPAVTPSPTTPSSSPELRPSLSPTRTVAIKDQRAEIVQPPLLSNARIFWLMLPVTLILLYAGYWLLTRLPDLVVKDSDEFERALKVWSPLVLAKYGTPRALKRFMNRVRYLAMQQRPQSDRPRLLDRMIEKIKLKLRLPQEEPETTKSPKEPIPESILVALAALQSYDPRWLRETPFENFSTHVTGLNEAPGANGNAGQALSEVKKEHIGEFGQSNWSLIDKYRKEFLKMSASVDVH
jgi:hypothetical protein